MKIKNTFIFLGLFFACFNTCLLKSAAAAASEEAPLTATENSILIDLMLDYGTMIDRTQILKMLLKARKLCTGIDSDLLKKQTEINVLREIASQFNALNPMEIDYALNRGDITQKFRAFHLKHKRSDDAKHAFLNALKKYDDKKIKYEELAEEAEKILSTINNYEKILVAILTIAHDYEEIEFNAFLKRVFNTDRLDSTPIINLPGITGQDIKNVFFYFITQDPTANAEQQTIEHFQKLIAEQPKQINENKS